MSSTPRNTVALFFLLLLAPIISSAAPADSVLRVALNRSKVHRGETVQVRVQAFKEAQPLQDRVRGILLLPTVGTQNLALTPIAGQPGLYGGEVALRNEAPEGMYVVHAWLGEPLTPTAVGKATFLLGRLVNDFFIAPYVNTTRPEADVDAYLKNFLRIGGNFLIAHNLITPTKVYYPSTFCKTDVISGSVTDLVELVLSRADKEGLAVLLSVSWDMTRQSPFKDRMQEIKAIAKEMYEFYKHHPSLAGFYSYQEGSGTYFVPYVREFSQFIKSLYPNLLTACAPHVDDPLLAGYLSTVEELDIIIYQAGVMASYRTDNRKKYPHRRVKDFCALGAGAKRLQNKIAINHVELFGYLENRLNAQTAATTFENIYQQILSAATVTDADGISFFTYHAHVYEPLKKFSQVERSRTAVADGVKAFDLITSKISRERNPLAVYFPYSDWIIERWPNYFLPALDAFRVLGVPVDVLPYAPPVAESVYPYYPFQMNQQVLERLLKESTVLVLPNVSGFQQTDSDLMKSFVEQGGVIVAFGPQIPMGRSYERQQLFGVDESQGMPTHTAVIINAAIGKRVKTASRFSLGKLQVPAWTAKGARVIAQFEDGSPAVTFNKYRKGLAVSILLDARMMAEKMPDLVRDVLDHAMSLRGNESLVDIVGTTENTDMAVAQSAAGFNLAVINHNSDAMEVILRPIKIQVGRAIEWVDLVTGKAFRSSGANNQLKLKIPGKGFRALEFRGTSTHD